MAVEGYFPRDRLNGELTRVDWDTALDARAAVSKHVLANYGESPFKRSIEEVTIKPRTVSN